VSVDLDALDACLEAAKGRPRRVLKIVVFDDADYSHARALAERYRDLPVYLQVGNPLTSNAAGVASSREANIDDLMQRFRWLAGKVTTDGWFDVKVLPQLHVLAWGNKRGV